MPTVASFEEIPHNNFKTRQNVRKCQKVRGVQNRCFAIRRIHMHPQWYWIDHCNCQYIRTQVFADLLQDILPTVALGSNLDDKFWSGWPIPIWQLT